MSALIMRHIPFLSDEVEDSVSVKGSRMSFRNVLCGQLEKQILRPKFNAI